MTPEIEIVSAFRKSSYSAQSGNCVELALAFRKSSYSAQNDACVELAHTPLGGRALRDSKTPSGPVQFITEPAWAPFLTALKSGELPTL